MKWTEVWVAMGMRKLKLRGIYVGLFTYVDGANSLQVTGLISGYCLAQCLAEVWIKRR